MGWLVNPIAELMVWTFEILIFLDDWANYAFILLGAVGMVYWLMLQKKYNSQAAADPNQIQ
jgi:hypothetical protein